MIARIKTLLMRLAEADMVFWLMPPLMVLLILGTITQRWIGLYAAHQTYFASFIFWLGPLPLPGGYILLGLLTLNLTAKFLLKSEWRLKKSGIILSHLGALVLLIGGLITSISAQERYMILTEGDETPFVYHYINRNVMVFEEDQLVTSIPFRNIMRGDMPDLPFNMDITHACNNCDILRREDVESKENVENQGIAQFMALAEKPAEKDPEANLGGFEFILSGTDNDGRYIAFDGMPQSIKFLANDKAYELIFGKEQYTLPFSIHLIDFVKDNYQGTSMARGYHSDILIKDGDLEWETRIEMNKPLRYKDYTFFQSSFDERENYEISILSVVKNDGWLFPYIGTLILGIGLLLHSVIMFSRKIA